MVTSVRNLLVGAVVGAAMLVVEAPNAHATFGSWGSSGGSSGGSWGSSGGSSGGSWGSSGGSYVVSYGSSGGSWGSSGGSYGSWGSSGGPIRRLIHAVRARRHYYYHYSSGGSYGSWGSSGGSYGSYGSHGGVAVYHYGQAVPAEGEVEVYNLDEQQQPSGEAQPPAEPSDENNPPEPPAETPEASPQAGYAPDASSVLLSVQLPEDAKVFVNGKATTSKGAQRTYVSRNLDAGRKYAYEVRAEIVRNGKTLTSTKLVRLTTGRGANLVFRFDNDAVARRTITPKPTTLILNVPADAKVILAGQETSSKGERREFSTRKLAAGQWANYPIRVELERNGQTQVREESISLSAGETRELTVGFDMPQVAQTASDSKR